jgi:aspartyl-tRNA(Asn)/glutamyl-tRNA(Gln) amidotransferase subunit A
VLALPSGLAADGVPTGVQVVGRTYDDPMVFRVGAALEAAGLGFGGDGAFRPTALLDDPVAAAQVS